MVVIPLTKLHEPEPWRICLFLGVGDVELNVADVAVLHNVVLALLLHQALLLDLGLAAVLLDLGVLVDIHGDEAALHVSVDNAGGLGSLVALVDRPAANLVLQNNVDGRVKIKFLGNLMGALGMGRAFEGYCWLDSGLQCLACLQGFMRATQPPMPYSMLLKNRFSLLIF